jgi:hypothetical protein
MNQLSIEQKMKYVRKALEMGAAIDVNFHNIRDKKEAEKVAAELSQLINLPFEERFGDNYQWYKIATPFIELSSAIFFDDVMEEDVDLSGSSKVS